MALVLADRVQETTNTTGTGTLTLAGAVSGFQSFAAVGNGNTTYYTITSGTDWEVGVGTYTASGTTLSRDTVLASSASGAKITVAAGAKVFVVYPAGKAIASGTGYFTDLFAGSYVDGLVADYDSANAVGRISVGGADGIRFYNGGPGGTLLGEALNNGNWDFNGTVLVGTGTAIGGSTNPLMSANGSANGYVQTLTHNDSTGTSASADFAAYPDNGTDASGWIDMGITSSTYSDVSYPITGANEGYIFMSAVSGSGKTGNLVFATDSTGTANAFQWYQGGFGQAKANYKMQLDASNLTLKTIGLIPAAGTASKAPVTLTAGTVLTTPAAGSLEYDTTNNNLFFTPESTSGGRGLVPATQYYRLTANGAAGSAANTAFFTSNNPNLAASSVYEIELELYYLKTTSGTVTFTINSTNSYTNVVATSVATNVTGMATVATAQAMGIVTTTTSTFTFLLTGSLTTGVNHWVKTRFIVETNAANNFRIFFTPSAGSVTPLRGSFWKCTKISNVGTYAA